MSNFKTNFRRREIKLIFNNIPKNYFDKGIELGAGSGIQTEPLFMYCKSLICTEYETRFNISEFNINDQNIEYCSCDAEKVDQTFSNQKFDLVFSSNMMEHLPNPNASLKGINHILKPDGVSICTIPNVFMKLTYLVLFYPAVFPIYLKRIIKRFTKTNRTEKSLVHKKDNVRVAHDNNPKYSRNKKNIISKYLIPETHGACDSNFKELLYWRKKVWIKMIEQNGFHLIKIIKLPVNTGYSFKMKRFCDLLYRIGFSSTYAYVAVKNRDSKVSKYFK